MEPTERATIFVTGGTGVVGRALLARLRTRSPRIAVLTRSAATARALAEEGLTPVLGDVADERAVARAMVGAHVVFHLAANPSTEPSLAEARRVHVEGTRTVFEGAGRAGVARVVHVSTVAVHGAAGVEPIDESSPLRPESAYARSKLEGEEVARSAACGGCSVVVVRPAPVYGRGDRRLLPLFRMALRRHPWMLGRGDVLYHPIHVDDLARALIAAAKRPEAAGETFLVAGPRAVPIAELYREIARAGRLPRTTPHSLPARPVVAAARLARRLGLPIDPRAFDFFVTPRVFRTEKAARELGFEPSVSLERGLTDTLAWYVENGYLPATSPAGPSS